MAESFLDETTVDYTIEQSGEFSPFALRHINKINFKDRKNLQYVEKVLRDILKYSEKKPWWIFINALRNYVDWLYIHSVNVAIISMMIATEISYKDEELWELGLGAFLHDAGKLLIPKSIIEKPDFLNDIEMSYVRQHCELGVNALKACYAPKVCTDIVMKHHERLDGSGYPEGLTRSEIELNSRIVMIADVVDAIISGRPYRASRKMNEAIRVLKSEKEKYDEDMINILEMIISHNEEL